MIREVLIIKTFRNMIMKIRNEPRLIVRSTKRGWMVMVSHDGVYQLWKGNKSNNGRKILASVKTWFSRSFPYS